MKKYPSCLLILLSVYFRADAQTQNFTTINFPNTYTNTITTGFYTSNFRSGFIYQTNGSMNYGLTGPKANLFRFRWLAHDNGSIDYSTDTDQIMMLDGYGNLTVKGGLTMNGNVGIGTAPAADKLTIDMGSTRGGVNLISDGDNAAYVDLKFSVKTTTGLAAGKPVLWEASLRKDGYFSADLTGPTLEFYAVRKDAAGYYAPMLFKSNGDVILAGARNAANGNVGVGTTTPAHKLDIQNGSVNIGTGANIAYRAGSYVSIGNMSYSNAPYIAFNAFLTTSDIPTGKNLFTPTYNPGGGLIIKGDAGNSGLHFLQKNYNNGAAPYDINSFTEVLTLTTAGNVGIGTTTTGVHKLAVEGSIGARKVKVNQAGWADFVFEPEYKLPSLAELEAFIHMNKHLPDVPTEKEVASEGLDLGDMNKKLLQKIEELTLYLIGQNKQLKAQQEMIDALKREMTQVKAKVQ